MNSPSNNSWSCWCSSLFKYEHMLQTCNTRLPINYFKALVRRLLYPHHFLITRSQSFNNKLVSNINIMNSSWNKVVISCLKRSSMSSSLHMCSKLYWQQPANPICGRQMTTPTWRQGLLELLGLLLVCDDQGVQVPAAAHLELYIVLVLLDLYGCRTTRTVCTHLAWKIIKMQCIMENLTAGVNNSLCIQEKMTLSYTWHPSSWLSAGNPWFLQSCEAVRLKTEIWWELQKNPEKACV